MGYFFSPTLHRVALLLQVGAGLFWLGWMVFLLGRVGPILRDTTANRSPTVLVNLRRRTRRIVGGLIAVIVLTGLYNMSYRGLFDFGLPTGFDGGRQYLVTLFAACLLFGIYLMSPLVHRLGFRGQQPNPPDPSVRRVSLIAHAAAFLSGVLAAFLGLGVGG